MSYIRKATAEDLSRIAEIYVYNNRLSYYPVFHNTPFSFKELQVISVADSHFAAEVGAGHVFVYDDGIIKGFAEINGAEICKLYVETFFQSSGVGRQLLSYAVTELGASFLWVLEKNPRAVEFYYKNGFRDTEEREPIYGVDGAVETMVKLAYGGDI